MPVKKKLKKTLVKKGLKKAPIKKKSKSLPVKKLSELNHRKSFVFYGRSGTGKTTLAGTFPGPILLLDIKDRGTDSLDSSREDIRVMEVESWGDFERAYWWLVRNPGKYKTVIADTVTQLQHLAVIKVLEDAEKPTERAGDWGTMNKRDWGTVSAMMKHSITNLRDLEDINVVFLAQTRVFDVEDDQGSTGDDDSEIGPRLSPASASHLNAEVSIIGNTYIKIKESTEKVKLKSGKIKTKVEQEANYFLRIGPNPIYVTKVRKPKGIVLPDSIEDPSYKKIMRVLST